MKYLILIFTLLASSHSIAAPKGKCVACVTQAQRDQVQKKLDNLRSEVARLNAENEALRNRPAATGSFRAEPRVERVEVAAPSKKNRITALAGYGPDSLRDNRRESREGNEVSLSNGLHLGGLYQRNVTESVSIGAGALIPTRPDEKHPTYLGALGFDF